MRVPRGGSFGRLSPMGPERWRSLLPSLDTSLLNSLPPRRPKSEKKDAKEVPTATQSPVSMKRKKKGFLPETKKRKKRKSEGTTQEVDATMQEGAKPATTSGDQPPSTGKRKRRRMKAKIAAQAHVNGMPVTKSPAPKPTNMSPSTPAKAPKLHKKSRKLSQVNGTTPVSPTEPAGEKQHQKELPKKVSGKSPPLALPRRKARLSLASRSPSLLQSGAKKKKALLRKGRKP